ncbi:MAG: DUF1566 domain-containing protein [Methylobacter sp.]|nr:MAG: DUF1566 domain-containing protein [Methylobacter sp.]
MFKHSVHAFIYVVLWFISLSYPITSYAQWLIKATPGNKQITLQWPPVKDASNYGVCYATEAITNINKCLNYAGGTWRNVADTTIKITRLSNGKKYYFRVLAENSTTRLGVSNTIAARPNKITALNDTGINNEQCYQLDSDTLVACASAAAKALNNNQDGMVGRDVTAGNSNDGRAGFSFTKIGSTGAALPVTASSWACVKDNVTGLIWENKTADGGLHDGDNLYTNYSADYGASHLGSATDASGFVAAVNQQGWCGSKAWRLPTADELQSIVDYSIAYPEPKIDTVFFPNTQRDMFWSSSPDSNSSYAWHVSFLGGEVDTIYYTVDGYGGSRDMSLAVRLVRASQ